MAIYEDYAVFGHPINHSKSPQIHQLFAKQTGQSRLRYVAWDVPADKFSASINDFISTGGKGLNCTIPLKQLAFQLADEKSPRAKQSKAVNTLSVHRDGSLFGDNTDGIGLVRDLQNNLKINLEQLDVLLLGAGGAGRGVLGPLLDCNPKHLFIANRTPQKANALVKDFNDDYKVSGGGFKDLKGNSFDLILNATAASLSNQLPTIPEGILKPKGICYDLAYGTLPTAFVEWGRSKNASVSVDGIGMLVEQAAEAFRIWRGILPNTGPVIKALDIGRTR